MRTVALRLRARILCLRCLAVLAGFRELNPQIARDVRQTALAGPPMLHDGTRKMLALPSHYGRPGPSRGRAATGDDR